MNGDNAVIVSAAQFKYVSLEKSLKISKQYAFEAAAKGAALIVFPELAMCKSNLESTSDALKFAQLRDGYQTQNFVEIAKTFNCHIAFGYVEACQNMLYNSCVIVGPATITNFQKYNISGYDHFWAQRSMAQPPVVITRAGRVGVVIGNDVFNSNDIDFKKIYNKGSVDTVAILASNVDPIYPQNSWIKLKDDLGINVVVANRVGEEGMLQFKGGSCIIDTDSSIWTNGSSFSDDAVVGGWVNVSK